MRRFAEVGIVGAGPAGARAAELLAGRGVDVVLFDPKAPWEKPCGGGLTSTLFDEVPELAAIGPLTRPVRVARVELADGVGFDVELERPIRIVARADLARWQLERALHAGAEHIPARVQAIERIDDGWRLDTELGSVVVGALVGADGAASIVRRTTDARLRLAPLATRVEYPDGDAPRRDALLLRFYPGVVGYLWDFPRPGHRSVGMEVPTGSASRAAIDSALDAYLSTSAAVGAGGRVRRGALIGTAPLRPGRFAHIAGDRFALLGDAAGLADPFTGEGIRNAFRSAALLAAAYSPDDPGWPRAYARMARLAFGRDLAVAALLRGLLARIRLGVLLVQWAGSSDGAYALVAAILDALALHDYRAGALVRRWRARRRGGRHLGFAASPRHDEPLSTLGGKR